MSERNYELRPQPVNPARAEDLTQTAFRCGGWSVRGPEGWRTWSLAERASAVGGMALLVGVALAGLALPLALAGLFMRWIGGAS